MFSMRPLPNTGVGMRKMTLLCDCAEAKFGWEMTEVVHEPASGRPAGVKSGFPPPPGGGGGGVGRGPARAGVRPPGDDEERLDAAIGLAGDRIARGVGEVDEAGLADRAAD